MSNIELLFQAKRELLIYLCKQGTLGSNEITDEAISNCNKHQRQQTKLLNIIYLPRMFTEAATVVISS